MEDLLPTFLQLLSAPHAQRLLADRTRELRAGMGWKQSTLAARAGVTLSTLRRFEQTGEVSLKYLMRICHALGRLDEFENILRPPAPGTLRELEAQAARPRRRRGSR